MSLNKLTALKIKNTKAGKLFDGGGLMLIMNDSVGKWVFRYSYLGKRREMGLGAYPETSLQEARQYRKAWAETLRSGLDPIMERDQQKATRQAEMAQEDPTFEEWAHIVFEGKKAGLRGGGESGRWFSPIKLYMIPKFGRKRMSQIHQSNIRDALKVIWRTKHPTAQKALQRTRIIFKKGKLTGIDCDPFTVDAAQEMLGEYIHNIKPLKAMPWQDVPALYARITGNGASHNALRLLILTAVRSMGVRAAIDTEIDDSVWTVPAERMKGKEGKVQDFRVPLSTEALAVIAQARELRDSEYLFPSYRKGFITEAAIRNLLIDMEAETTIHGFRTSFRTWVQDTDAASYDVAETALAHKVGDKVERSYARSDMLEKRAALMEKWANYVIGKKQGNVVPLTLTHTNP